jgi:hypothetical protein
VSKLTTDGQWTIPVRCISQWVAIRVSVICKVVGMDSTYLQERCQFPGSRVGVGSGSVTLPFTLTLKNRLRVALVVR